jgi:hypothetical protein
MHVGMPCTDMRDHACHVLAAVTHTHRHTHHTPHTTHTHTHHRGLSIADSVGHLGVHTNTHTHTHTHHRVPCR